MSDQLTNVNNAFKTKYGKPNSQLLKSTILKRMPWENAANIGGYYSIPTTIRGETALNTINAGNTQDKRLKDTNGMVNGSATIQGANYILESVVGREDIARGATTVTSAEKIADNINNSLTTSLGGNIETDIWYGQVDHLGVGASAVETTATTATITFDKPTFAYGIWSNAIGGKVFLPFEAGLDTFASAFTIVKVDPYKKTMLVSGTAPNVDAIKVLVNFKLDLTGRYLTGASDIQGMTGLVRACSTSTGVIYGISKTTYPEWDNILMDNVGAITLKKILQAASYTGVTYGEIDFALNSEVFSYLVNDNVAFRKINAKEKDDIVSFSGPTGTINIIGTPFLQPQHAFAYEKGSVSRHGSMDIHMVPLNGQDNYLIPMGNSDAYKCRAATTQGVLANRLGKTVFLTDITIP